MDQEQSTKRCPYCGEEININAIKCKHCGEWLEEKPVYQPAPQQPVEFTQVTTPQPQVRSHNGVGTAGFVLSLIDATLIWVPVLNVILWFIGMIMSFVGVFKRPRGLAIAGLIISMVNLIAFIFILAIFGDMFTDLFYDLSDVISDIFY